MESAKIRFETALLSIDDALVTMEPNGRTQWVS